MLSSPDGRLQIVFKIAGKTADADAGQLTYSVSFNGRPMLADSALSLELKDQPPLGSNVRVSGCDAGPTVDSQYSLLTGKTKIAHDHYSQMRLQLVEAAEPNRAMVIEARAYDDAVAFRYVVPAQPEHVKDFQLVQEHTEFNFAKDATSYALVLPSYQSMYESEYIKLPISAFGNQGGVKSSVIIGLPLLTDVPGAGWMAITEADLRDYASMYLTNPGGSWGGRKLVSLIAPKVEGGDACVTGTLPHHSAWRILLVGEQPGRILESTAITSLSPESKISDTSWIRPGKSAWDWWSGSVDSEGKHAFTTANMKRYVDFAAGAGLQYMLIDAGWASRRDVTKMSGQVDVPQVVEYARGKGVRIWIWASYRDISKQMNEAFPLYEKWGVAGVKIDFVERDDQDGIEFYYRTAALAAKHHLMLDFHGCTKPTGIERTWPNIMGYEAVLGMEQSKGGMRDNPDNRVTLAFTRMLAGPTDFTPGGFDNVTRDAFVPRDIEPMVMGTRAHHLAMYLVGVAPFQMVSDRPEAYANQPAFEFIRQVPTTWNETRVIEGTPDSHIVIARRSNDDWFIGAITNWNARSIDIPLDFLANRTYTARIYADGDDASRDPKSIRITSQTVEPHDHLSVQLQSGGGFAAHIQPSP